MKKERVKDQIFYFNFIGQMLYRLSYAVAAQANVSKFPEEIKGQSHA